jgi:hypothetical protein
MSGSAKSKPAFGAFVVDGEGDKAAGSRLVRLGSMTTGKGINVVIAEGLSVSASLCCVKPALD